MKWERDACGWLDLLGQNQKHSEINHTVKEIKWAHGVVYEFQPVKIDFVYSDSVETTTQGLLQRKLMKIIPR